MEQLEKIWSDTLDLIKNSNQIDKLSFDTWIATASIYKIEGNDLILKVDNDFFKKTLESKYLVLIKNAIKYVTDTDYNLMVISQENIVKGEAFNMQMQKVNVTPALMANLNPKYVFESFVVGNSNRMAHAASLAVAESPAGSYNPLFLYGNSGLGKTHLMHSIAHYILQKKPDTRVLYVTSETFTNELINSISNNKNEEFRNKYRNIDVLLIDDIQFIEQKERTQEEFFHTFNSLHSSNKQIIISSDRPPKEMRTLEERLRTRFESGLIADIQPPDYETRIAILRKKVHHDGISVPDSVINHIAKYITTNIRELEGALTRIVALAKINKQQITVELAEDALKDIFERKTENKLTTEYIMEIVADFYKITVDDIKGSKRPKKIAYPRQIGMYLSRKLLDISLTKIGEDYGGRDHTTIIHACQKIEKDLETDKALEKDIIELEKRIKGIWYINKYMLVS